MLVFFQLILSVFCAPIFLAFHRLYVRVTRSVSSSFLQESAVYLDVRARCFFFLRSAFVNVLLLFCVIILLYHDLVLVASEYIYTYIVLNGCAVATPTQIHLQFFVASSCVPSQAADAAAATTTIKHAHILRRMRSSRSSVYKLVHECRCFCFFLLFSYFAASSLRSLGECASFSASRVVSF